MVSSSWQRGARISGRARKSKPKFVCCPHSADLNELRKFCEFYEKDWRVEQAGAAVIFSNFPSQENVDQRKGWRNGGWRAKRHARRKRKQAKNALIDGSCTVGRCCAAGLLFFWKVPSDSFGHSRGRAARSCADNSRSGWPSGARSAVGRSAVYQDSSEVQRVRLSRMSCMSNVESLYESSLTSSSLSIAASKPSRAMRHASCGLFRTS